MCGRQIYNFSSKHLAIKFQSCPLHMHIPQQPRDTSGLLDTRVCLADCDWALLGSLQAALGSWHAGHGPNTGQIIGCAANVSQLSAELCHLQIECRHQM